LSKAGEEQEMECCSDVMERQVEFLYRASVPVRASRGSICELFCVDTATEVERCCKAGVQEAETCGDVEMQAEFLYLGTIFCIVSDKPVNKVLVILLVCTRVHNIRIMLSVL